MAVNLQTVFRLEYHLLWNDKLRHGKILWQRIGRNPKTGTEVPISPRRVMVFKPSGILKQRINSGPDGSAGDEAHGP